METCPYYEQIQDICISTFKKLNTMYNNPNGSKFIFPHYTDDIIRVRVSEQEARFAFLCELEKSDRFYFSIETPTHHKYKDFSTHDPNVFQRIGGEGRSGEVDLTIYKDVKFQENIEQHKILNVEFKKGQAEKSAVRKDILKLFYEAPCGLWFHVIQHTDKGTLPELINKLNDGLDYVRNYPTPNEINGISTKIMFYIVVLEKDPKISRHLSCVIDVENEHLELDNTRFLENIHPIHI